MELITKLELQFINILSENFGLNEVNAGYIYALLAFFSNYWAWMGSKLFT